MDTRCLLIIFGISVAIVIAVFVSPSFWFLIITVTAHVAGVVYAFRLRNQNRMEVMMTKMKGSHDDL
jgi:hypothetical protein